MTTQIAIPAFEVEPLDGPRSDPVVRVLVVDDNPIDRLRASRLVEQDPQCRSVHAKDGAEALQRLADHDIAMVLTDLQMDGMDGLELVRTIRKEHAQIPVILMTAHGSEDVAMEALRLGATDYVPKQRLSQELRAILARALRTTIAGHRRRRCLQSLVERQSQFELGNDPDLLPPLLEFLQDEMIQLGRWDSAELMRTTIALDEALRNALFHGNLEVSSDLRQENDRLFHELARQRSTEAPYQDRRIRLMVAHGPDHSRFEVHDDGPGFDTSHVDRPIEPEDLLRPSGRGLLLMRSFMDSVVFNQAGNAVTLIKRRNGASSVPLPVGAQRRGRGDSGSPGGSTGLCKTSRREDPRLEDAPPDAPWASSSTRCCSINSTMRSASSIPSDASCTGTVPRNGSPGTPAARSLAVTMMPDGWTTSPRMVAASAMTIARCTGQWSRVVLSRTLVPAPQGRETDLRGRANHARAGSGRNPDRRRRDPLRRDQQRGCGECVPPDQRGGGPRLAHRAGQSTLP